MEAEINELLKKNYTVTVISVWGGDREKAKQLPYSIIFLPRYKTFKGNLFKTFIKHPVKSFIHYLRLMKFLGIRDSLKFFSHYHLINFSETDHIHAHQASNAALRGLLAAKYHNIPFTCTGHGTELLLKKAPYLKYLIKNSDTFITVSKYNKAVLSQKYKLDQNHIKVNYYGIETSNYKSRRKENSLTPLKIISVTSMKKFKGVEYLIAACELLKRQNLDFQCDIIGGGENLIDMSALIQKNELDSHIRLYGNMPAEKIKEKVGDSSIFVLPSLTEGIPLVCIKAMAMEVAVIASKITGLSELINDSVDGFLVEPKKPTLIARRILHLSQHPDELNAIQKEARKTIQKRFELSDKIEEFESIIKTANKKST